MASADLNDVICSICLNIPTDPVDLKCGHVFCWACIDHLQNSQEEYGSYTCPECTAEFQERPAPQRKLQISPVGKQVETMICCTYCIHSTVSAVKYCAMCEAFLCNDHLKIHTKSAEHVLSEPSTSRENRRCSDHRKLLEYYCTEDKVYICEVCKTTGHRGHKIEARSNATEKEKFKKALENLTIMNAETDARVESLQEHVKSVQEKANNLTEKVTSMLLYTRTQLDDLEKRILKEITSQREKVSLSVSGLIQQLELEKRDLLRKIEELYNMADPVPVLEELFQDNSSKSVEVDIKEEAGKLLKTIGDLDEALITLMLNLGLHNIMTAVKTRTDMQDPADLLLDIDTAGHSVHVSGDRKTASRSQVKLQRPETPGRFQNYQVLSTTSFSSGRHYWEMETSRWSWMIGVCYPSMDRGGNGSSIGSNKKSWCLVRCYDTNKYKATHDGKPIEILLNTPCHRFGIYLDYDAGQLSFYALCDPIRHLHTFNAAFTEPLHAAFWVWGYSMLYKDIWVRITRYEKL